MQFLHRVWYVKQDGSRALAIVLAVDISHPPPFFRVRLEESEVSRDIEASRMRKLTLRELVEVNADSEEAAVGMPLVLLTSDKSILHVHICVLTYETQLIDEERPILCKEARHFWQGLRHLWPQEQALMQF